ncbi:hydroxymethylbilane synthase [uncultured Desulfuromonas sp.]|uniref:hydroxymethylbilane synthase n=1 Tax=uncultured Desulfuromonas sp. TaxID=181013 RepID=UPI002AAAA216|nr:hydroxymethylbilane synthase [uncultured Desulfuromonas sp.]
MSTKIKIGTRRSKLALWQAYYVEQLLQDAGMDTEIVEIDTRGDQVLDVSIAKIGSKGVFTEELEDQLRSGDIDIAVHSAKDMQSELPEGFEIIAFTIREKVNDVVVSRDKSIRLGDTSRPLTIGSSSVRRRAILKAYYPHLNIIEMRGNLQTRIGKMDDGQCDAILLAYAGVNRMEYNDLIVETLPLEQFIPPVGQGSVAIESATNLDAKKRETIRKAVNHPDTEFRLLAERAFLKTLKGGCSIPAFCMAELEADNQLKVTGGMISLDGQTLIKNVLTGARSDAEQLGDQMATLTLEQGGAEILAAIRAERGE